MLYQFSFRDAAFLFFGLFLFAFLPSVSHAQADRITGAELGHIWVPPVPAPGSGTMVRNYPSGASVAANASTLADTGGGLAVSKSARVPLPDGRVVDIVAKAPITRAAMGKAFGAAVALVGGPVGVGLFGLAAIIDYMNSSGLRQSPTSPGTIEVSDPSVCTVAPCYLYSTGGGLPNRSTRDQAGRDWAANRQAYYDATYGPQYTFVYVSSTTTGGQGYGDATGYLLQKSNGAFLTSITTSYYGSTVAPSPPSWLPASSSQIESAAATPTMKPEWLQPLLDAGVAVDAGNSSLTGPASVPGPVKSTTQQVKDAAGNVTGTTTINTSTVTNISYAGNTYVTNNVSTITTTNPDGTSSVATVSDAPVRSDPVDFQTCGLPGKPACKLDETGTPSTQDLQLDKTASDAKSQELRDKVAGSADKNFFTNWSSFFTIPPVVSCAQLRLPKLTLGTLASWDMPAVDTCQVIDPVRAIMAWIWAFGAFWLCLGWVRECF